MSASKKTSNLTKKQFLEAYITNMGQVVKTCSEVGISLSGFYKWKREDPEFKKLIDEGDALTLDFAEQQLYNNIADQSESSIFFYLKKKGKSRGYGEGSATDYVYLDGWAKAKSAQERLDIINYQLSIANITPAQAAALSTHVANEINIESRIDNLTKDVAELKKMISGGNNANRN